MRNHCFCIRRIRMDRVSNNVIILCSNLNVVFRFELSVKHGVFFHPHEGCIVVRFGITVFSIKNFHGLFISLFSWKNVLLKFFCGFLQSLIFQNFFQPSVYGFHNNFHLLRGDLGVFPILLKIIIKINPFFFSNNPVNLF